MNEKDVSHFLKKIQTTAKQIELMFKTDNIYKRRRKKMKKTNFIRDIP